MNKSPVLVTGMQQLDIQVYACFNVHFLNVLSKHMQKVHKCWPLTFVKSNYSVKFLLI